MPTLADAPLRKVTLNLYEEDYTYLEANMDQWSVWIRDIIHAEVRKAMNTGSYRFPLVQRRTIGDLEP